MQKPHSQCGFRWTIVRLAFASALLPEEALPVYKRRLAMRARQNNFSRRFLSSKNLENLAYTASPENFYRSIIPRKRLKTLARRRLDYGRGEAAQRTRTPAQRVPAPYASACMVLSVFSSRFKRIYFAPSKNLHPQTRRWLAILKDGRDRTCD
jgi:hypothetical protein